MKKIKTLLFLLSCIAFFTMTTVKAETLLTVEQWEEYLPSYDASLYFSYNLDMDDIDILCTYKYELSVVYYSKYWYNTTDEDTIYIAILSVDYGDYTQYDTYVHRGSYGASYYAVDIFNDDNIITSSSYSLSSSNFSCPAYVFIDFEYLKYDSDDLLFTNTFEDDDYNNFLNLSDEDVYEVNDYEITHDFETPDDSYELTDDDISMSMDELMGDDAEKICFYDNTGGTGLRDIQIGIYYVDGLYAVSSYVSGLGAPWNGISDIYNPPTHYTSYIFGNYDFASGICPAYAYTDAAYNFCFDSNGTSCNANNDNLEYWASAVYGEIYIEDLSSYFNKTEALELCESEAIIVFQLAGYVIYVIKILVPLIIISLAIIELFKVVISGEDKDLKALTSNVVKRLVAGIIIFFIPTIINLALTLVGNASETIESFEKCDTCLLDPFGSTCEDAVYPYKDN